MVNLWQGGVELRSVLLLHENIWFTTKPDQEQMKALCALQFQRLN